MDLELWPRCVWGRKWLDSLGENRWNPSTERENISPNKGVLSRWFSGGCFLRLVGYVSTKVFRRLWRMLVVFFFRLSWARWSKIGTDIVKIGYAGIASFLDTWRRLQTELNSCVIHDSRPLLSVDGVEQIDRNIQVASQAVIYFVISSSMTQDFMKCHKVAKQLPLLVVHIC